MRDTLAVGIGYPVSDIHFVLTERRASSRIGRIGIGGLRARCCRRTPVLVIVRVHHLVVAQLVRPRSRIAREILINCKHGIGAEHAGRFDVDPPPRVAAVIIVAADEGYRVEIAAPRFDGAMVEVAGDRQLTAGAAPRPRRGCSRLRQQKVWTRTRLAACQRPDA